MQLKTLYLGDTVLSTELRVCGNFLERARGLLFRPPLQAALGEALLIPSCNSIHTFWMSYPITVLFLAGDGRIVRICSAIKPGRLAGKAGASCVIECAEGTAWADQLSVGERLRW